MHLIKPLFGQSKNKKRQDADNPTDDLPSKGKFNRIIIYATIAFFVIAVIFVGFTYYGKWQAGLIEVGSSVFLFVILLHVLKTVIPQYSGKTFTTLSVLIALMFLFVNFSLQRGQNKRQTFNELLVGELLVKRIIGKHEELPDEQLAERLKNVIPGEFAQTKTEKDTIESSFEKPEKDLMGEPVTLPIDKPGAVAIPIHEGKVHFFYVPEETINYKLEVAGRDDLVTSRARTVTAGFDVHLNILNEKILGPDKPMSMHIPLTEQIDLRLLRSTISDKPEQPETVFNADIQPTLTTEQIDLRPLEGTVSDKQEQPATAPNVEIQPIPAEDSIENGIDKQVEEKLQTQQPTGE